MEVGKGMLAASRRCCILRPDGPAADPFGNDCRTPRMLKSGPMEIGIVRTWGTCGGGQLGCLESNSFHVSSLFGAMPAETEINKFLFKMNKFYTALHAVSNCKVNLQLRTLGMGT